MITCSYHVHSVEPPSPSNVTVTMPLINTGNIVAGSLNITLQWDDEDSIHLGRTRSNPRYTITVYPEAPNSGSVFYTPDTSMPLALHYDQDYNISVVASNCAGNSTPVEIRIRLGKS